MICLDTNVVIAVMRERPAPVVERFLQELSRQSLALPVPVLFELQFGVANSARREENTKRLAHFLRPPISILPFDADDAAEAGEIRAALARSGTPIGPYDILIAAQARRRDAVLVTANFDEFARVQGLMVEDWTVAAGS